MFELLIWLFISLILILLLFVYVIYVTSDTYPKVQIYEDEKTFENDVGKLESFPNLDDNASLELSIIVPAYNEQDRLPKMLEECVSYLEENFANKFEIIIVDDGSKDATSKTVLEWSRGLGKFIYTKCYKNSNES
jgi:dolichyl-phosphate beta-glucosyltransferase